MSEVSGALAVTEWIREAMAVVVIFNEWASSEWRANRCETTPWPFRNSLKEGGSVPLRFFALETRLEPFLLILRRNGSDSSFQTHVSNFRLGSNRSIVAGM